MNFKLLCIVVISLGTVACGDQEFRPLNGLIGLPQSLPEVEHPSDNLPSEARWELGKKLFHDQRLSVDSSISCASCHKQEYGFGDNVALSLGVEDRLGTRNSPSIINVAFHPYLTREGGVPTLEMQVLVPIQEHVEFNFNIIDIVARLGSDSIYNKMSMLAYGESLNAHVITRAIANYERSIISTNSPFDSYYFEHDNNALNESQTEGLKLFFSERTQCFSCHGGFNFTDYSFQNNGLYLEYDDIGRQRLSNDPADYALFKVPSLRNIELTAPYMHDGSVASLQDVIEHYSEGVKENGVKPRGLKPIHLTEKEKQQLISFLEALTDQELIENEKFKNE